MFSFSSDASAHSSSSPGLCHELPSRAKLLMLQRKDKLHTTALLSSAHYCLACLGGLCHKKQTPDLFSGMHSFENHIVFHLHHVASVLVKIDR